MFDKAYEPHKYEDKIYKIWEESGAFTPEVDWEKNSFTISLPPPNVTGNLHLGHASMLAIEDILIRYHRMLGESALWLPGTDHAAIATQNKVEKVIAKENLTRHDLGREKFLERVWEFKEESQNIIKSQMRKMGASVDWTRDRFTMDEGLNRAVYEVFVRMYNDGLIYRGNRIVNWCPRCHSTLANDEVVYEAQNAKLYTFKYSKDFPFTIATTRPETKLGDTAVAVNPKDKRYQKYIGKEYHVDFCGCKLNLKIIKDRHIEMDFGTGALGVTPAHSMVDWEMATKNNLEIVKVIDEDGKIHKGFNKYSSLSALDARKLIVEQLEQDGLLEKEEDFSNNLSVCYRCSTAIEPIPSLQWFVAVDKPFKVKDVGKLKWKREEATLKELANHVIKNKLIEIIPARFDKTYFHWMEELHDWCISRQIWWGHQVPVWYCDDCEEINVAVKAPEKCQKCDSKKLTQDPDTLDTWFSSGLWTFSTLGWPDDTDDLKYFHPTSVLETGYDILFFWVARMIIMTTYALNDIPFKHVYLHGLIRDKHGEKMSKSKPETCIDPLDVIERYGTDAVRLSLVIGTTPGNDIRLYEEKIANFRNFTNKLWNISRYILTNCDVEKIEDWSKPEANTLADKWILSRLHNLITQVSDDIDNFRLSEGGTKIYDFLWRELADWYIEISKEEKNEVVLMHCLENILKLMHPYMPFVTEKVWESFKKKELLIQANWPQVIAEFIDPKCEQDFALIQECITKIRATRSEFKIPPKELLKAHIQSEKNAETLKSKQEIIKKLARLEELVFVTEKPQNTVLTIVVNDLKIFLEVGDFIDFEKEKNRIKNEIEQIDSYIKTLQKKLKNKGFSKNAPASIIDKETEKLAGNQENSNSKKHLK